MTNQHDKVISISTDPNKKTLAAYIMGLVLSLFLTLAAFGLVQFHFLEQAALYIALSVLAVTQFIVQSVCFLRLNKSKEGQWNLLPFLFMIFIVAILVGGSLWIMYNLNINMM